MPILIITPMEETDFAATIARIIRTFHTHVSVFMRNREDARDIEILSGSMTVATGHRECEAFVADFCRRASMLE